MEKYFLPHDLALELKELGFNESCLGKFYYNQLEIGGNWCNNDFKEDPDVFISAPLYQQAFRWFREKYFIVSYIVPHNGKYTYNIISNSIKSERNGFETYEEAELECLKKLIEIVKTK